jgi:hypothetical protein
LGDTGEAFLKSIGQENIQINTAPTVTENINVIGGTNAASLASLGLTNDIAANAQILNTQAAILGVNNNGVVLNNVNSNFALPTVTGLNTVALGTGGATVVDAGAAVSGVSAATTAGVNVANLNFGGDTVNN